MTWVKMDDEYPDHPKVEAAGPLAAWLNVCAWAYAARYLTDGFIPEARVERLADVPDPQALADKLVEVGLWEAAEGGYMIHDYLNYNPTAEQVKADREAARERMQAVRSKRTPPSPEQSPNNSPRSGEVRANNRRTFGRSSPSPVPVNSPILNPPAATQQTPTGAAAKGVVAEFAPKERAMVDLVGSILTPIGLEADPRFWRKVLDAYGGIDLETEAIKIADWQRRHKKRQCSQGFVLNWLEGAGKEQREVHRNGTPSRPDDDRRYAAFRKFG